MFIFDIKTNITYENIEKTILNIVDIYNTRKESIDFNILNLIEQLNELIVVKGLYAIVERYIYLNN